MLIGLHGRAGVGKDASFGFIKEWVDQEGRACRREAFADRLKISAARALGHRGTPEECIAFCNALKQRGMWVVSGRSTAPGHELVYETCVSGRTFLQRYGTEAHREVFADDFWVRAVMDTYEPEAEILVITDVRFPNEAEAVRAAGGQVWHIIRPGQHIEESAHASEQPLSDELIDITLVNNASLDELRDLVLSHIERLAYS